MNNCGLHAVRNIEKYLEFIQHSTTKSLEEISTQFPAVSPQASYGRPNETDETDIISRERVYDMIIRYGSEAEYQVIDKPV
jgi:hypothetical protein